MSVRELVVLGTAGQVPTRTRNHNGYLLRWDSEGILFDPGEGTQRQLTFAGVAPSAITRICITHFHGDHCLGLPGVLQRLALDRVTHAVDLYFPASGLPYVERLCGAAIYGTTVEVRAHAIEHDGVVEVAPPFALECATLDHRVPTLGFRVVEPDGRRMLPERLEDAGVRGPDVARLQREAAIVVGGRTVRVEDVSEPRRGQSFAFVMDTRPCAGAVALARGVDVLVCEATFLSADERLAADYGHMTAAQAARVAADAGAGTLVLTHYSQRYKDEGAFGHEARAIFHNVVVARDLDRIPFPPRRP